MSDWYSDGRWWLRSHGPTTIGVIDRHPDDEAKAQERQGQRVPFGFARAIPVVEPDPMVWEGED